MVLLLSGCVTPGELKEGPDKDKIRPLPGYGTLDKLPFKEAWYGMYFQDAKVGHSHFKILRAGENFKILVESDISLKTMKALNTIRTRERVLTRPDLTLISFESRTLKNDQELKVTGRVERDRYILVMETGGERMERVFDLDDKKVRHNSAISLYPALHGLEDGQVYSFQVFQPSAQRMEMVRQEIYMVRGDPGPNGAIWKVNNLIGDAKVRSWLNKEGMVVIERAAAGNLMTILEDKESARRPPDNMSAQKDLVMDWSLIRTDEKIARPWEVSYLKLIITGLNSEEIPSDHRQQKTMRSDGSQTELVVQSEDLTLKKRPRIGGLTRPRAHYLKSTPFIQSDHERIRSLSKKLTRRVNTEMEKMEILVQWTHEKIKQTPRESFTALATLKAKEGECEAHANLYTALARAARIPTRLVQGLVYSQEIGFIYHAWAESYVDGWVAIDPTMGQTPADATHIKLFVGDLSKNASKLMKMVGGVRIKILDYH